MYIRNGAPLGTLCYIMDTPSPHPGSLSSLDSKLRHSDFTLLLSRVGLMRLEIINLEIIYAITLQ